MLFQQNLVLGNGIKWTLFRKELSTMENEKMSGSSCGNIRVLIVDDSGFSRSLINKELNEIGIGNDQIKQSPSGADAISKIKSESFDLFILDIIMAGIDGIGVLKEVKQNQPNAKVIMCSGSNSDEIIKEVVELGIDAFLVKPYQSETFKTALCRTVCIEMEECSNLTFWEAKCHVCDSKMIEVNLINTVSFCCPNSCMTIGPLMNPLVSQSELDEDYKKAIERRNKQ